MKNTFNKLISRLNTAKGIIIKELKNTSTETSQTETQKVKWVEKKKKHNRVSKSGTISNGLTYI